MDHHAARPHPHSLICDFYREDQYRDCPQEHHLTGTRANHIFEIDIGAHAMTDPPFDDMAIVAITEADAPYSFDCGNGRIHDRLRPRFIQVRPYKMSYAWDIRARHKMLVLGLSPETVARSLGEDTEPTPDFFAAVATRPGEDAFLAQMMSTIFNATRQGESPSGLFVDSAVDAMLRYLAIKAGRQVSRDSARACDPGAARYKRVIDYIEAHLGEDIKLKDLADVACLSQYHLIRAFKKRMGKSPFAYLAERRIERARALLATGGDPLAAVALDCGFANQAHFTKTFRNATGVTPGRFRKIMATA